jgi:glycosyltransferase involved in cell wall biosynthesis
MYCGSCSRDNALAVELLARGHEVTLVPLYTPTNPDEPNVSRDRVLFGGISIYLQQSIALFRKTPRFLDRLWDSPAVIGAFASRSLSTDPKLLGELMISMLEGDRGVLRKEFSKLLDWVAEEPVPDVVNLPNALLISLAGPLRQALQRPIVCTLQGEDLFLDGLVEPYRSRASDLIRRQTADVDRFIAVSDFYVPVMAKRLAVSESQIAVVPLGINMKGYQQRRPSGGLFRVGYFARIAPEKGLQALADAYVHFRKRTGAAPDIRLEAAGYLSRADTPYFEDVKRRLEAAGLLSEFTYRGAVDRDGKLAFLQTLDVLSVPAPYDEPKGVFLLEAMASGVPVVATAVGGTPDLLAGGASGMLVPSGDAAAMASAVMRVLRDSELRSQLAAKGRERVTSNFSQLAMVIAYEELYHSILRKKHERSSAR